MHLHLSAATTCIKMCTCVHIKNIWLAIWTVCHVH